jgi:hypothetical protein
MRGLKTLVIVMGVLLVLGFAALVAVVAVRVSHRTAEAPAGPAYMAAPVALPSGARIEAIGPGTERIVLAIMLPDGTRELVVIDAVTGRRLGTIPLREAE